MVRHADNRERETEILDLVVENYIRESKPIGSTYLCDKYHLPYSSATVRNIMEALEKKGFLSHIHTSSGRVPTQEGFKYYVENIKEEDMVKECPVNLELSPFLGVDGIINHTLDVLAEMSGYASLVAVSESLDEAGGDEKVFFRGARFILEQPEFEDISRLKNLFYTLEVKMTKLQVLLFHCLDEKVKILIGDDIGFEEISDCSLVVSGSRERKISFALALLGPMRMDYIKASTCLYSIKNQLKKFIGSWL